MHSYILPAYKENIHKEIKKVYSNFIIFLGWFYKILFSTKKKVKMII